MKRIQSLTLSSFSADALIAFCAEVEKHARAYLQEDVYRDFGKAFVEMRMKCAEAAESQAAKIDAADAAADLAWNAIYAQLRINIAHYAADVQDAAFRVLSAFSKVNDPTRLPYGEEYAQLNRLLGLLDEVPAETRRLAMVDGWIEELRKRVERVCSLLADHSEDGVTAKETRLSLIDAYDRMIHNIHSLAGTDETTADAAVISFIDAMNMTIDDHLLMQKIREKIEENASH